MVTQTYAGKLAPAVGGGLCGLPSRKEASTSVGQQIADYTKSVLYPIHTPAIGYSSGTLPQDSDIFLNNAYSPIPTFLTKRKFGLINPVSMVSTIESVDIGNPKRIVINKDIGNNTLFEFEEGNALTVLKTTYSASLLGYGINSGLNGKSGIPKFLPIGTTSSMTYGYGKLFAVLNDDLTLLKIMQISQGSTTFSPFACGTLDNGLQWVAVSFGDFPTLYPMVITYDPATSVLKNHYEIISSVFYTAKHAVSSGNTMYFGGSLNSANAVPIFDISNNTRKAINFAFTVTDIKELMPAYRRSGGVYFASLCSGGTSTLYEGRVEIGYFNNDVYTRLYSLYDKTMNDTSAIILQCFETLNYVFVAYKPCNVTTTVFICVDKVSGVRKSLFVLNRITTSTTYTDIIVDYNYETDEIFAYRSRTYGEENVLGKVDYLNLVDPTENSVISAGGQLYFGKLKKEDTVNRRLACVDLTKIQNFSAFFVENTVHAIDSYSVSSNTYTNVVCTSMDATSYFTITNETVTNKVEIVKDEIFSNNFYIGRIEK